MRWDGRRPIPAPWFAVAALVAIAACNGAPDLPPVQASSAHFRYHARTQADVQSDILERLERNRADFQAFTGLADESVTDYYYFTDPDDLLRNGPCRMAAFDCTVHHSLYTSVAFHEHELVHSYLADVGAPSVPVLEGMAEAVHCLIDASARQMPEQDWRRAVQSYPSPDPTLYAADQRFMTYLLKQMGVPRTVDYYRHDTFTLDPALFASQFQGFWSMRIDDVWSAAVGPGVPEPSFPICPCVVDPIAITAAQVSVPHPNGADYRPIAAGTAPMTIDFSSNGYINFQDCGRESAAAQVLEQSRTSRSTVVLQPGAERYFLTFETAGTDTLTTSGDLSLQASCSGLSTFAVIDRAAQLGVSAPREVNSQWYIRLSSTAPVTAQRTDPGSGALAICADCTLQSCQSLGGFGAMASVSDGAVLQFTPAPSVPNVGLDAASIVFN